MSINVNTLLRTALRLDSKDRAELAAEILASLDGPADADVDAGEVELEPWDAVRERIEKGLERDRR